MKEIILLFLLIIIIIYQINNKNKKCKNISGSYNVNQYDIIYKYNHSIRFSIEAISDCKFKIVNVKSKSLLNDFYEEYEKYLEGYITILDNELKGGTEIIYVEKFNNNFIRYKGYLNKNDIYIKKDDNSIIVFKRI
jgi:hypothetical protein